MMMTTLLLVSALVAAEPAEQQTLQVTVGRGDTQVRVLYESKRTILDVDCRSGIGKATVKRLSAEWPQPLVVRLHLRGLESLEAVSAAEKVAWSVASNGQPKVTVTLPEGEIAQLGMRDYRGTLRIVADEPKIPLAAGEYFEARLPKMLFQNSPEEIKLRWIDFYR
ncbi:MAG: hypothetical protein ACIALR_08805 [Blastopirellula sp. JB062]